MADCGFPLPCESTISSATDALKITNNGNGAAITAVTTSVLPTVIALKVRSNNGFGLDVVSNGTGVASTSINNIGVRGVSTGSNGIRGESQTSVGVRGSSVSNIGVFGESDTEDGVVGSSNTDVGVIGDSIGQGFAPFGVTGSSMFGVGVGGFHNGQGGTGVFGTTTIGTGVIGTAREQGTGVSGSSISGIGVDGSSDGGFISAGVFATSNGGFISAGVFGLSFAQSGVGIYGRGGENGLAGLFDGNVDVNGSLTKSGGGFKIDHPLEPAQKYLSHSFVESPEMKNIYDGIVILDKKGECSVELPKWFEALNCDFRYQLTSVGKPAPNLYVAREVANNSFSIAGGKPGIKVSWQVVGIRKDAWAQAHPLIVEEEKPTDERGYYRHPELYNQPPENNTFWKGNSELIQAVERQEDLSRTETSQIEEQVRYLREKMDRHREQLQDSSGT